MTMDGLMTMDQMHKFKTRNKLLLYSASSCGIWRSQHGHFIFKAISNNCRSTAGVDESGSSARNKRLLYSASSCGIWRS